MRRRGAGQGSAGRRPDAKAGKGGAKPRQPATRPRPTEAEAARNAQPQGRRGAPAAAATTPPPQTRAKGWRPRTGGRGKAARKGLVGERARGQQPRGGAAWPTKEAKDEPQRGAVADEGRNGQRPPPQRGEPRNAAPEAPCLGRCGGLVRRIGRAREGGARPQMRNSES